MRGVVDTVRPLRLSTADAVVDVEVRWTGPPPDAQASSGDERGSRGLVWLQHGFARGPRHLEQLARAHVIEGFTVARPEVASFRRRRTLNDGVFVAGLANAFRDRHDAESAVAESASSAGVSAEGPLVLSGHSAGGAVVMHAAACLVRSGQPPAGVVLADANESLSGLLAPSLEVLTEVPVLLASAAPSWCNRLGQVARLVREHRAGFVGVSVTTGTHCDAEGEDSDRFCGVVCGPVRPENAAAVRALTVGWAAGMASHGGPDPAFAPGGAALQRMVDDGLVTVLTGARGF